MSTIAKGLTASLFIASTFAAQGEELSLPKPPNDYKTNSNIPKGTLSAVIQYPTTSYQNRPVRVYTPPGYSATRAEKYPVLYLHHGIGGNENAWTSSEGNADKVMDYLYSKEDLEVTPMIVVMPMGNMTGTGDTWNNYEKVLLDDLIPYIEEKYNASPDANMRAMAGLSMGGGQTTKFAYRNLDVFTWIGAFSPAPTWGEPNQNIQDVAAVKEKVHLNYFSGGTGEADFLARAKRFHDYLEDNGVTKVILQTEQGLGHEPESWNRNLHHFAQRIFKGVTPTGIRFAKKDGAQTGRHTIGHVFPASAKLGFMVNGPGTAKVFSLDGKNLGVIRK